MLGRLLLSLAAVGLARACVQYTGTESTVDGSLSATLVDNGQEVCWFGPATADSGGLYRFTCIAGNVAAIAYNSGSGQIVEYANPGGNYQFYANMVYGDGNSIGYSASEYGC